MIAIRDTTEHDAWVRVRVDGWDFDVAFRDGQPVAARFSGNIGEGSAWWLLASLDPASRHARAASAAEAFLAQFRLPAVAS
jgi:hypothetical protein